MSTAKPLLPQQAVTAKGDAPSRDLVEIIQRIVDDQEVLRAEMGGRAPLASRTASASATVDFTEFDNALYRGYEFDLEAVKPATDAAHLAVRFSTDGGATYDAGASDYSYAGYAVAAGGTVTALTAAAGSAILLTFASDMGNAAGERGVWGRLVIMGTDSAVQARADYSGGYDNTAGAIVGVNVHGVRRADQDTTAIRFLMSSGNIASGTIRMYGIR